jgi:hypothetical protein
LEEISRIFSRLRTRAVEEFPRLRSVILEKTHEAGGNKRHFAFFDYGQMVLGVSPDFPLQSRDRIEAVMRHELGHALDALYAPRTLSARLGPLPATPERRADAIAEAVFGTKIQYDGDDVQTLRRGRWPRPWRLGG